MLMSLLLNFIALGISGYIGIINFYYYRNYFVGVFSLSYALLFCLVPIVNGVIFGAYMYHPEAVDGAIEDVFIFNLYSISSLLFVLFFVFVFYLFGRRGNNSNALIIEKTIPLKAFFLFGLVFLTGFILFLYSTGFSGHILSIIIDLFNNSRMAYFANDNYNSLLQVLSFYLMAIIAIYSYLDHFNKYPFKILSIFVYSALIVFTVSTGSRQFLILAFSGFFFSYYHSIRSTKELLRLTIVALVLLLTLFMLQFLRSVNFAIDRLDLNVDLLIRLFSRGDLSYFYYSSLEAIRQYVDNGMSFYGNIYRNLFFFYLPTEWTFGIKQRDLSILFSTAYQSDVTNRGGNYPPGLIGLFFMNFGVFGFFLAGWFIVGVVVLADRLRSRSVFYSCFGSLLVFWVLQTFRGTLLGFYQLLAVCIMVYIVLIVFKLRFGINRG